MSEQQKKEEKRRRGKVKALIESENIKKFNSV
jgi:hypothetical protein